MSNRQRATNLWTSILTLLLSTFVVLTAFSTLNAQSLETLLKQSNLIGDGRQSAPPEVSVELSPLGPAASAAEGQEVTLSIRIDMPADAYTYSQNREFGGATAITLSELAGLEPVEDAFAPDREPKVQFEEVFQQNIEKFVGEVTFSRRFRLTGATPPDQASVAGTIKFQVCDASSCTPHQKDFEVFLDLDSAPAAPHNPASESPAESNLDYRYAIVPARGDKPDPLMLQFELSPADARPGETVTLAVTMSLETGWHTFGLIPHENQVSNPTVLKILETSNLKPLRETFAPVQPPETLDAGFDDIREHVHHDVVTWTQTFTVVEPGPYGVRGEIDYQVCKTMCLPPKAVDFALGSLQQSENLAAAIRTVKSYVPTTPAGAQTLPQSSGDVLDFQVQSDLQEASLPWYLLTAFLGGLILNIMPCVLPVLAIKVMSFVQQAGESRGRVLLLNVSYSLGVIGVFLLLATLAVTLQFGWGGLFTKPEFILVMTAVVFVMGLSLLGVFEIPLPGMVGSAGGHHREGLAGAFLTGIFATLLATPCTGPFMGSTLAWSVKQTPPVVFLVWGVMGLGMASPYLLVGLFPKLVHFLPRPGMWMVRFKEFAGFTLMAATIWLLSTMPEPVVIPTLVILLGIALAVWMIGTLYDHASTWRRKTVVRLASLAMLLLFGWYGYTGYQEGRLIAANADESGHANDVTQAPGELPWQPFSEERLRELFAAQTPVLIDFTADWCQICKVNERIALNTQATAEFVAQHGIVPLIADWTEGDPVITKWLQRFDRTGVPLYVIIPPGKPDQSIVLEGQLTQGRVLEALKRAVSPDVAATELSAPAK